MQNPNLLGINVVLITLLIVSVLLGGYKAVRSMFFNDQNDSVASNNINSDIQNQIFYNPEEDFYYNELLPDQEVPLISIAPLTQEEVDAIKQELNMPSLDTYTGRYLAQLPPEMARPEVLNPDRLTGFVNANKGEAMPLVAMEDILIQQDSSADAIREYLKNISPLQNPAIKHITSTDIEKAHAKTYAGSDTAMEEIIKKLTGNLDTLQKISVPNDIAQLHLKLVSASKALLNNVKMLHNTPQDFVGGLIAAKRIEELSAIFSNFSQEIKEIENKYQL